MADKNKMDIKIADFGFAAHFSEENLLTQELGSAMYMSPEIIKHQKYNSKVDIWSTGIMAHFLLIGEFPFAGLSRDQLFQNV